MIAFILIVPILFTIPIVFCWKLFERAGYKGFFSAIPFYNLFILSKIVNCTKWWWYKWTSTDKEINQNLSLIPLIEINSKCITDLKVKCKNIKLLGKKNKEKSSGSMARQRIIRLDT